MTRRRWIALGVVALLVGVALTARHVLEVSWSAESIRALVERAGVWAPLTFIALVAFRLLVMIPSQVLLTGAGLLFGAPLGTLYGAIGLTLSAAFNFAFVQIMGAARIRDRIPPRFDGAMALARSRAGAGAVALATGYPVGPITGLQMAAAVTGMSFATFLVAVGVGATVRSATFSYFGSTLLEGERLLVGLAVIAVVAVTPWLFPRSRAWLRQSMQGPAEP